MGEMQRDGVSIKGGKSISVIRFNIRASDRNTIFQGVILNIVVNSIEINSQFTDVSVDTLQFI